MDEQGATEIVPTYPADVQITQGLEYIRGLRLSDKGMYRWYADCCRTPLANANPDTSYMGMVHNWLHLSPEQRQEIFGPIFAQTDGKSIPFRVFPVMARFFLYGLWKKKGSPHPFYGEPALAEPKILSTTERARLGP